MSSLSMMTISEVAELIRARKVSPLEVVEEAIRNTHRLQGELNAYITFLEDEARERARKLTEKLPQDLENKPLYGIPVGLKDVFYTKGVVTSGASELCSAFRPTFDSTVTARLDAAGAVMMGKLNLHEWAFGPTTAVSYYGATRNPYDHSMVCGGSSGGSAVAVAAGLNYMAMGSDAGGSIRIPASMCGVVGFKPSIGLISLYGVMPLSETLDHAGPLTRSVMDAAITMDAVTGFDPNDLSPNSYKGEPTCFAKQLQDVDRLEGVTIGVPEDYFFEKTDESIEKLVRDAIRGLEDLGAKIRPVRFDFAKNLPEISSTIVVTEASWVHRGQYAVDRLRFAPAVRARLDVGIATTAMEYISAMNKRKEMIAGWERMMKEVDAVVCPTLPMTAFPIEGDAKVCLRGKQEDGLAMCTHHTRFSNVTGSPALSLPVGLADNGLPAGMMIMGAVGDDLGVLKIGHAYEKHFPANYPQF